MKKLANNVMLAAGVLLLLSACGKLVQASTKKIDYDKDLLPGVILVCTSTLRDSAFSSSQVAEYCACLAPEILRVSNAKIDQKGYDIRENACGRQSGVTI